ncbi:uncharacterized protein LOC141679397 [Apium graveolens]|uniref:uncharacterized protein LOC141679397 n=1 Tax=Apium graveolens TaxID=4045 RepID=UPI003D791AF1
MLDAVSGGALWAKSYEKAYELIEMIATNDYKNPIQRLPQGKEAGILEVDTTTAIMAQLKTLTMKVDSLAKYGVHQIASVYELCAGAHAMNQCAISSESAQFVSNFQRPQQPVPATYLPNNRNHPDFSRSNYQSATGNATTISWKCRQFSNKKSELEELRLMCKIQAVSIKTLENQIGHIANALLNRPQETLPSDTEANPGKREVKEQLKAITLRSGKVANHQKSESENFRQKPSAPALYTGAPAPAPVPEIVNVDDAAYYKDGKVEMKKNFVEHTIPEQNTGDNQVYPPPPYPKRLQKQKFDKQFAKFLEVFKKLHINIPFAEALEQMPSYAKFMKDPGSFTIPCTIGELSFDKCLYDLGASINLMPLSVFRKLGLPDPKPTNMSLQLANRYITYLRGELIMRVQDQDVSFNGFNAMKFSTDEEECYKVELVDYVVNLELDQLLRSDTLERALTGESDNEVKEGVEQLQFLNASPWKRKLDLPFESLRLA